MERSTKERLEAIVREEPDNIDARMTLGETLRNERSPAEAIEVYDAVLELDPDNPLAYLGKGQCWAMALITNVPAKEIWDLEIYEEEMLGNAMEFLEQAAELDPELTEAYNVMGRLLAITSQDEEAVDLFLQSLAVDPTQLEVVEDLRELTGKPAWKILDKGTWMGEDEED